MVLKIKINNKHYFLCYIIFRGANELQSQAHDLTGLLKPNVHVVLKGPAAALLSLFCNNSSLSLAQNALKCKIQERFHIYLW